MNINGFIERFEQYSVKHKLFKSGEKILIGFSGGADSTALLLALWHLKSKYGYSILAAHVNYDLRGNDSKLDEQFVRKFCFDRNISLVVKNITIDSKSNIENHAREDLVILTIFVNYTKFKRSFWVITVKIRQKLFYFACSGDLVILELKGFHQ